MGHLTVKCTSVGLTHGKVAVKPSVSTHTSTDKREALRPATCWIRSGSRVRGLARITAVPLCTSRAPIGRPQRSSHLLSQPGAAPKAERAVGSYHDVADSQSGACGPASPAPRVTSSRPAARPMARPRDGADQQKRRHPSASMQGQLGLGRGPPVSGRRRRRESIRSGKSYTSGPARLV